jgi:putative PIN family toxin of toxin-antitoxin system
MRSVLDTDVVVAAMRSPSGASAALLRAALDGKVQLLANVALILEYEAVCKREVHLTADALDIEQAGIFVDALAALAEPVESHFIWRPQLKDPSDEMVLEAAVNGQAQAIVTFNLRDFSTAPERFGLRILLPRDALRRVFK